MRFSKVLEILQNFTYGNVNQSELGRVLGVSRSNINYKKENDVELSEEDVKKIETFYGIEIQQNENTVSIPVLGDVEASMGYGVTVYNENQTAIYNISKQLARDLGISEQFTKMMLDPLNRIIGIIGFADVPKTLTYSSGLF